MCFPFTITRGGRILLHLQKARTHIPKSCLSWRKRKKLFFQGRFSASWWMGRQPLRYRCSQCSERTECAAIVVPGTNGCVWGGFVPERAPGGKSELQAAPRGDFTFQGWQKVHKAPRCSGVGSQQIQQRQSRLPSCRDGLCAPGWSERGKSDGKGVRWWLRPRAESGTELQRVGQSCRWWNRTEDSGTELPLSAPSSRRSWTGDTKLVCPVQQIKPVFINSHYLCPVSRFWLVLFCHEHILAKLITREPCPECPEFLVLPQTQCSCNSLRTFFS